MATAENVLEPITRLQLCSLISGLREASVGTPVFRILNEDGKIRWEWSFEDSDDPRKECLQELNRCNDEAPSLKLTMVEAVVKNRAEKMCEQAASLLTRFMDQMDGLTVETFLASLNAFLGGSKIPDGVALYWYPQFSFHGGVFFDQERRPFGIAMKILLKHFEEMKRERSNGDRTKNGAERSSENSGLEADEGNGLRDHSAGL